MSYRQLIINHPQHFQGIVNHIIHMYISHFRLFLTNQRCRITTIMTDQNANVVNVPQHSISRSIVPLGLAEIVLGSVEIGVGRE
jgi:hypothetical protein